MWKPIDTTLQRVGDGWRPKATNVSMTFSAGSGKGQAPRASRKSAQRVSLLPGTITPGSGNMLATFTVDGHDIVLTWPETVPTPVIDGSRALYPEILPGADLVLTADDDGFAQLLVVKNRAAAADPRVARLAYGLSSPDLSFSLDPVSGIVTAEDEGGDPIAQSPTPLMWDSAGVPANTDGGTGGNATPEPEVIPSASFEEEAPDPDASQAPTEAPAPSPTIEDGDADDPIDEVLPDPSDEAPDPSTTAAHTLPPVPPEPTPEPSRTGAEATLSLPSLNGPQPDSNGTLVETHLDKGKWVLIPDQDFLNDPTTVYPVFVDPSIDKHTNDWTTVYDRHPYASFYNGKNFNKGGTDEARVGFESDTWGTSRSFFTIDWDKDLAGAVVERAWLRALNTYSWSCQKRAMSVHLTGPITNKTNWKNAPSMTAGNQIAWDSFAHGWKTNCRDDWVAFNVKNITQTIMDKGTEESITIGFKAADEKSQYSWKKFMADDKTGPSIDLEYNRRPERPTNLAMDPGSCDKSAPYISTGTDSLVFWATGKDKDKNLSALNFHLWKAVPGQLIGPNLLGAKGRVAVGSQVAEARVHTDPFNTGSSGLKLVSGQTYSWRVTAVDAAGKANLNTYGDTPCRFIFDTSRPTAPKVTSPQFPDARGTDDNFENEGADSNWSTIKFGTAGSFSFQAAQTDVVRFDYSFNGNSDTFSVGRPAGAAVTALTTINNVKPPLAGPNVLYVKAVDGAGNASPPTKYFFYVTPRDKADTPGDFTGDQLPDLFVIDGNGDLRLYPSQAQHSDLAKGTGRLSAFSMSGAYRGNPAKDPNGGDDEPAYATPKTGYWKGALITHQGDYYGGDGLQDLIARVEGKLWVYPGDGYGSVNIDKRREIVLPANAPDPAGYSQIIACNDATGDGRPDFFVTNGAELWALTGYNGATVERATRLAATVWSDRDLVMVQDVNADGITDLVYRNDTKGMLFLRLGKEDPAGGVDFASLASAANSASPGGVDITYGSAGWQSANIRLLMGTPSANGDAYPDVWTVQADGVVKFYAGAQTTLPGGGTTIVSNSNGVGWKNKLAIG
ncbi:DNRLRE domain-containing protein [Streptomyces sp. NPDC097619]|uniref:DNRLRE domain-containing protein n=1 Tax=Streptomyces sp. NPDC097619 TaxID=3157228 RepID=UPI003330322B